MKKFMKAIAFVTVMCMALSTVAFAADKAEKSTTDDKTVIVTVTEADADDQVALYIVGEGKTTSDAPLYIDQKPVIEGEAKFTAKIAGDVDAVQVFVGYAANDTGKAIDLGKVELKEKITRVTVTKLDAKTIANVAGQQQIGSGVWGDFSVTAPEGVEAAKMIWAIRYADTVKYSDAIDVADYHIGNIVSGSVKLGFAFLNGFNREGEEIDPVTITGVDAIFLFVDTDGTDFEDQEVYTNPADEGNKKNTAVAE